MKELDDPESHAPEIFGFIGLALAVLGISTAPTYLRIACLIGAAICLPISFLLQTTWPRLTRWGLALLTDIFFGYIAWTLIYG